MSGMNSAHPHLVDELAKLLRGTLASAAPVANTLSVQALGFETFGRTDARDLFSQHPVALSTTPHVLTASGALAVLDVTPDGRSIGVFADVVDGVLARIWVCGPVLSDAVAEPAVAVASDDFLNQDRLNVAGELRDHPLLDPQAWPQVQAGAGEALLDLEQSAAASSNAIVVRAFSCGGSFAALYTLRVLSPGVPRLAHRRLALAMGHADSSGALMHRRLAISDALPVPPPVSF